MSNNSKIYEKYRLAYTKLRSIFDLIYEEFNIKDEVNPIEHIKYRIKKIDSIEKKLIKKGYSVTEENIDNLLYDVVGVRIVCSFLSDLEKIKETRNIETKNIETRSKFQILHTTHNASNGECCSAFDNLPF